MRAHPLGVALVVVGSALSVATTPAPAGTRHAATPERAGQSTLVPGEPSTVALRLELACVFPGEPGDPLRVMALWFQTEVMATPVGEGPDTAARTWVHARTIIGGEPWAEDEAFLAADAESVFGAIEVPVESCVLGEPCEFDIAMRFEADAGVDVAWRAQAKVHWFEGAGRACQIFLLEA